MRHLHALALQFAARGWARRRAIRAAAGAHAWVSLDRPGIVHDRPVAVTLGLESPAAVKGGVSVPRIDLKCLAIIRDGAVDLIFSLVGEAAIGVSVGVLWIDLDCLGEICD